MFVIKWRRTSSIFSWHVLFLWILLNKIPLQSEAMAEEGDRKPQFYACRCFTTDNIFLGDYKLHVRFVSEQQFRVDYQAVSLWATTEVLKSIWGGTFHWQRCIYVYDRLFIIVKQLLRGQGCVTEQQFEDVLKQVQKCCVPWLQESRKSQLYSSYLLCWEHTFACDHSFFRYIHCEMKEVVYWMM